MKYKSKLADIRESQGRMKTWVAKQIGVSQYALSNWEKGENMIPYDKARMISKLYGVAMEELYEEVEE